MSRKARKFKAFFRPKLGDLQIKKKKKKKRSSPKFRVIFRAEIRRFFPPKIRWSPNKKKKKKKKVFAKIQSDFSAEIRRFFLPKIRWSPKKKKVFTKIETDISSNFANSDVWGGLFSNWGLIFHFSHKIGLKSTKNMRFCILHKSMGGLEPPRPPPPWLRYWFLCQMFFML